MLKVLYILATLYAITTGDTLVLHLLLLVSCFILWYKPQRITRTMRLRYNGGRHTTGEWLLLKFYYGNRCAACGMRNRKLTKDHIIPVSKGGKDDISNIQPLCVSCNSKKGTKHVYY